MENFKLLKIEDSLKNSLHKMNFTKPTPIQGMAIPAALEGKDILGTAQTGTGKTLAFSIPLINKLILDKNAFALVMCPTRELATQVMEAIKSIISDKINIKTALLIGGESMQKQLRQLGNRSRIIVGTPGRINDHLKRKSLNLSATKYLVLDETDRMLDMGFTPQIEMVLKFVPKDHQTLLFSATLPNDILRISERYLNKPERISTGNTSVPIAKIKQETLQVFKENKYDELIDQFLARKGSILVFVKTKRGADKMVKKLKEEGHSADAIHGDLRQSKRDRVINSFRKGLKRILIATDVAARGLDIPLIQHVINYDLPQVPEDYIHRIGRTARAGSEGSALTFLTSDDRSMWNSINKLIDPNFKSAPSGLRRDSKNKRRGKRPNNKKSKARDEKRSYGKGRRDRTSSFRDKPKSFSKDRSDRPSKENLSEINLNLLAKIDQIDLQEMEKKNLLALKENQVSEINLNLLAKIDQIDLQEMEKKNLLALKENQVSEINLNLLAKIDQIDLQEMEKKNLLALKENQVLQKKIIQNLQVLQIIQSILEKNLQKTHLQKMKKKALDLKVRKNLKVETVDLKTLHLKNIVKRELVPKIF